MLKLSGALNSQSSKVSVIIPTYQREEYLYELIDSIWYYNNWNKIEIIVVDNNSDIDYKFKHPVKVINNMQPCALSVSRNLGAAIATGDYLFFIDDDNTINKNTIRRLVDLLHDPKIGIAAPIALMYGSKEVIDGGAFRSLWNGFTKNNRIIKPYPFKVDEVSNAFMLRKKDFPKFDDNFVIELDEADLCQRLKQNGLLTYMQPDSIVYHKANKTMLLRRKESAYYAARNRLLFQSKHCFKLQLWVYYLFFMTPMILLYLVIFLIYKREFIKPFLKGVKDGRSFILQRLFN